jgi:hypothetical protein
MERGANTWIESAMAEPAARRMLEAARAVCILKSILTREERMGLSGSCMKVQGMK